MGLLSSVASLALLVDLAVAILMTTLPDLPKGLSPLNWLDDFLYLPEVLYVLSFIWLICSAAGKVQCRSLARRQIIEMIARPSTAQSRSSTVLNVGEV